MSRNLKEKIALGIPLTEAEEAELLRSPKDREFAEGMHKVDLLVEAIRREPIPQSGMARISASKAATRTKRVSFRSQIGGWGAAVAALAVLSVPVWVVVDHGLIALGRKQVDFSQPPRTGLELYAVNVSSFDERAGKLIPYAHFLAQPHSGKRLGPEEKLPADPKKRGHELPAFFFLPSNKDVKRISRTNGGVYGSAFAGKDHLTNIASIWMKEKNPEITPQGPAIVELEGRISRLQKWSVSRSGSKRRVIAYGTDLDNFFPRVELQAVDKGRFATIFVYEIKTVSKQEFDRLQVQWNDAHLAQLRKWMDEQKKR
jgi:hypothetical protein